MRTLSAILRELNEYFDAYPTALKLRDNIVGIEPIFDNSVSKGGIIIPDAAKGRCSQGIVKYLGKNVKELQVGDYVIFSGYNGDLIAFEDELIITMPEDFVQARIIVDHKVRINGSLTYDYSALMQEIRHQVPPFTTLENKIDSREKEV